MGTGDGERLVRTQLLAAWSAAAVVFYEVTSNVDKKVRAGAERKELQEFLKESNFAKTLLSLRDMFQANNI